MLLFPNGHQTRLAYLALPIQSHYAFLYNLALESGDAWSWTGPPSEEEFAGSIWNRTFANAVVLQRGTDKPLGYVALYDVNLFHGHGYLRAYVHSSVRGHIAPIEGILGFVDCAFQRAPLRRLYLESAGRRATQYESAGWTVEVARFPKHLRSPGGFDDLVTHMVDADRWTQIREQIKLRLGLPDQ